MTGDLNIHHARWLRFSFGNTLQGTDLRLPAENLGLQQLVREPTRNEYLLDLYLTDVTGTKIEVGVQIADRRLRLGGIPRSKIKTLQIKKQRFNLKRAD